MRADPTVEREVFAAVDAFLDALAARDLDGLLATFVSNSDVALYGSEISEVAIGPEALRHFLGRICALPSGPRLTPGEWRVATHGDVAWLTAPARVSLARPLPIHTA